MISDPCGNGLQAHSKFANIRLDADLRLPDRYKIDFSQSLGRTATGYSRRVTKEGRTGTRIAMIAAWITRPAHRLQSNGPINIYLEVRRKRADKTCDENNRGANRYKVNGPRVSVFTD